MLKKQLNKIRETPLLIFVILTIFLYQEIVFAQGQFKSQTAIQFFVADEKTQPGDIIVKKEEKLVRADKPYDSDILGVVAFEPLLTIGKEAPGSLPIVISGITLVKVSGEKEAIKKGDYLTSSNQPGVAQKAVYPGFVIGKSLEDFEGKEGLIKVFINPHWASFEPEKSWQKLTFKEVVGRILSALERDVPAVLRYIFAILLASGSFIVGFRAFVRNLKEGIVGISRNPLAKNSIRLAMILNLIGIVVITLAGLGLALLVILL